MSSKYHHDLIVGAVGKMQAEIERLENEVATLKKSFGTLQPYVVAPASKWSINSADENWSGWLRAVEESRPICVANNEAAAANQELVVKLAAIIEGAGLATTVVQRKSGRSYKSERVTAEWLSYLRSAITGNSWSVGWLDSKIEEYARFHAAKGKERDAARAAREREFQEAERRRLQTITLAMAGKDLGIDPTTLTADELAAAIRKKDKYLDLAVAMRDTRGDWSDGFYRVEDALSRFNAESPLDKEIAEAVGAACYGEERDGRIFRDLGEHCYDNLFGRADPKLVELYGKVTNDE